MEPKYFILILFFEYLNNTFSSETEATITEKKPQSILYTSPMPHISTNSQNTMNSLSQPKKVNISSGQPIPSAKITGGQPTPARKPVAYTSARLQAYNVTGQLRPLANTSSPQTAQPVFTSARHLPSSIHTPTSQPPTPPVYTPTQQPSFVNTSSGKPVLPTVPNLPTKPTSTVYIRRIDNLPMTTPGFTSEPTSSERIPSKTNYNSTAVILISTILICMLVAIIMIVLWKRLRKPVLNDHNWAGRSPFADGETPDICMDNIRENEVFTKRTSIVSLMTWKPNKNMLAADDLEVKLFESNENTEDASSKREKTKDQINGTSEDSADRSTIGTAVSSSDDADLPLPPPLLDLEGQESSQSDKPTMITISPLPNDSTNLQPSLDSLNQVCEDHNSEIEQAFPPLPDSFNLPLPPVDFIQNQEDFNNESQCQFSIPPDSDQHLNESLPPASADLL